MDRLLSVCHSADVHHAERFLGEAFLEFELGVRQEFSVSQMQEYVTDLSLQMKKFFGLVLCSTCYCSKCGIVRRSYNLETALRLSTPEDTGAEPTLEASIDSFTSWHHLRNRGSDGLFEDSCPLDDRGCGHGGARLRKDDVAVWPEVLTVFVRRRLSAHVKDYRRLAFPDLLQRGPHYNLMAVVVHEGKRPYSGHYYAYCRIGADWFKYNDSIVQQVAPREVLRAEATLLIYES